MKHLALALVAALVATPEAAAQEAVGLPKPVPDTLHAAVLAGGDRLGDALTELARLREADEQRDGTWRYLEALTLVRQGDVEQASQRLELLIQGFPDGPYGAKARLLQADLLMRLGRFEQAQAILDAEVVALRSTGRRDELATTCLELVRVETAVDPDAPQADRDPGRLQRVTAALPLLDEVLTLDTTPATERAVLAAKADLHLDLGQWAERSAALGAWLDSATAEATDPAGAGTPPTLDERRRVRLDAARAMGQAGRRGTAKERLDLLAVQLDEAGLAAGALAAEVDLERAALARDLGGADDRDEAIAILERHLDLRSDHPGAARVLFDVAELHLARGRGDEALEAWGRLLDLARPGADVDEADRAEDAELRMEARWRIADTRLSWGEYDAAIAGFRQYLALFPAGPRWGACQAAIIDAAYWRADDLADQERFEEARSGWRAFLEDHPVDQRVAEVQRQIADSYGDEAELAAEAGDAEGATGLWRQLVSELEQLVAKRPGSDEASDALLRIGEVHEEELDDLAAAIDAYRRCDFGGGAWRAQNRLVEMLGRQLEVRTERVWRPGAGAGAPAVRLTTRNLDEVEVELYRLDLESYFRRHRTHRDVDALDLDLIEPDSVLTHAITPDQRHARVVEDLALPIDGPGAWVVTVVGEEQRATTLVLASDLDLVVESNQHEALVLVQDRVARRPLAGARVLVSVAGSGPLVEGVTGDDGVARLDLEREGAAGSRLAVLAEHAGHLASTGLDLPAEDLTPDRSPASFVYTERSTYRAGDRVHWRAVLRRADALEGWRFTPGETFRVTLTDPAGTQLVAEDLPLGPFGTLTGSLSLPDGAARGSYTLTVAGEDLAGTHAFQVADFAVPRTRLAVEPEALVLLPGQTQTFELTATLAHGAPLADARVVGTIGQGEDLRVDLVTDAEGHARCEVPLEALGRSRGSVPWTFRLLDEEQATSGSFFVATRELDVQAATPRTLVLAGETFPVDVTTRDAAGTPTARSLELRVLRETRDARGRVAQVPVLDRVVTTGADGAARIDLRLEVGGEHELRLAGLDALGNPVSRVLRITVSDEDDTTRLRFLVDDTRVELGQDVALRLVNRAEPGPALVVHEGDGILGYEVVELVTGDNTVAFAAGMLHWPNTTLRVDLVDDERLHRASQELWVDRSLRLELETGGDTFLPGATADVGLRLVDGLGAPVVGEFSLDLVDAAFLDRFPTRTESPREVFEERRRRAASLRAATSAGFAYTGATRRIAAAVLAEAERQQQLDRFADRLEDARGYLQDAEDLAVLGEGLRSLGYAGEPAEAPAPDLQGVIGLGGGAGGVFGGRSGGRRNLRAAGGSAAGPEEASADIVTAFWRADVVTDAEGRATVALPLPDRGGAWRLTLRGVDAGARTAVTTTELTTAGPLLVDLDLPAALRRGDRFGLVGRVHVLQPCTVTLRLVAEGLAAPGPLERELAFEAAGSRTVDFGEVEVPAEGGPWGTFRLEGTAEGLLPAEDVRRVALRPYGVELTDADGGLLDAPRTLELELPAADLRDATLEVHVGADLTGELLAVALGRPTGILRGGMLPGLADEAQDLLGAATLLAAMRRSGDGAEGAELARRVKDLAAGVLAAQHPDGGWAWAGGRDGGFDVATSAWCLLGLEAAAAVVEVAPSARKRAADRLVRVLQSLPTTEDEPRALVLHALAAARAIDQDPLSGPFRARADGDPATLAHLALAYAALDRPGELTQLAELLAGRADGSGGFGPGAPWCRDDLRTAALCLWALSLGRPEDPAVAATGERLLAAAPWGTGRRRGLVVAALARQAGDAVPTDGELRLAVTVDDGPPRSLVVPAGLPGRTLRLPLADYAGGTPLRVALTDLEDGRRGDASWPPSVRVRLTAWSGLPPEPDWNRPPTAAPAMELAYRAAPARLATPDGSVELMSGFSILGRHQAEEGNHWENVVTQLPLGERVRVLLRARHTPNPWDGWGRHLELEVPLPAGTTLVPGTLDGARVDWRLTDGRLFLRPTTPGATHVTFDLVATRTGTFRVPPPRAWFADRPDDVELGFAGELTVLPAGTTSGDAYDPTPDERLDRGRRLFQAGDLDGAHADLAALHGRFEGLFDDRTAGELSEMLLALALRADDAGAAVEHFEILTGSDPDHVLSLGQVVAVGRAYRDLGEHERAARLFQATLAESFTMDLRLAGALDRFGDLGGSLAMLDRLWREYPDLPDVVEARLVLTDQLLARSTRAHQEPGLVAAGRDEVALVLEAILQLREFLALYPDHALAPDAGMNLVTAYLQLEDHERVERLATRLAARFTEPRLRDEFRYTQAVAAWYQDEDADALALLTEIVTARYPGERGREERSPNRELALYLSGQIHHAAGDLVRAAELYAEVRERFSDADELLDLFDETRLALPEVTRAAPDEDVVLALDHKGLEAVELQLFPVDLMTLYLREGDLEDIREVNLAGISPVRTADYDLEAPLTLDAATTEVELGTLDPGAYLAILRSEGRFATGLVLVSDLELAVREDPAAGAVRVEVRQGAERLEGVDVRVVGSADGRFRSGETDRRGLFTTAGILGQATVIARLDRTRYAFHRGTRSLGDGPAQREADASVFDDAYDADFKAATGNVNWYEGQIESNVLQQGSRRGNLEQNWSKQSKGLRLDRIR